MVFNIGARVVWSSHGGSTKRQKEGAVVAIVPAGADGLELARSLGLLKTHVLNAFHKCDVRKGESYLVSTPGDRSNHKSRLYWPKAALLSDLSAATPPAPPAPAKPKKEPTRKATPPVATTAAAPPPPPAPTRGGS